MSRFVTIRVGCLAAKSAWAVWAKTSWADSCKSPGHYRPKNEKSAELGRTFSAADVHLAHRTLAFGAAGTLRWWHDEGYDLLITPLMAQPRVAVGENRFEVLRDAFGIFAMEFSITGQPAISVPALWTKAKMPVGVQIVSDIGREDLLLNIAAQLELINPWIQNWPTPVEKSG